MPKVDINIALCLPSHGRFSVSHPRHKVRCRGGSTYAEFVCECNSAPASFHQYLRRPRRRDLQCKSDISNGRETHDQEVVMQNDSSGGDVACGVWGAMDTSAAARAAGTCGPMTLRCSLLRLLSLSRQSRKEGEGRKRGGPGSGVEFPFPPPQANHHHHHADAGNWFQKCDKTAGGRRGGGQGGRGDKTHRRT